MANRMTSPAAAMRTPQSKIAPSTLQVLVTSVDTAKQIATTVDSLGRIRYVRTDVMRIGKGETVDPGESWIIDQSLGGQWTFAAYLAVRSPVERKEALAFKESASLTVSDDPYYLLDETGHFVLDEKGNKIQKEGVLDPATFNPFSITWKGAWWASDPAVTSPPPNGSVVASWPDGSTNAYSATQPYAPIRPIFLDADALLNNRPVFQNNEYAPSEPNGRSLGPPLTAGITASTPFTLIWVGRIRTPSEAGYILSGYSSGISVDGTQIGMDTNAATFVVNQTMVTANAPVCIIAVFNGASSALRIGTTTVTGDTSGAALDRIAIGAKDVNGVDASNVNTAFAGLYLGDLRSNPAYNNLRSWVTAFYGVTA